MVTSINVLPVPIRHNHMSESRRCMMDGKSDSMRREQEIKEKYPLRYFLKKLVEDLFVHVLEQVAKPDLDLRVLHLVIVYQALYFTVGVFSIQDVSKAWSKNLHHRISIF